MKLSARNQLTGTVKAIKKGGVMAEVTVALPDGQEIVSVITVTSANSLDLKPDMPVTIVIKSTEVMLAVE